MNVVGCFSLHLDRVKGASVVLRVFAKRLRVAACCVVGKTCGAACMHTSIRTGTTTTTNALPATHAQSPAFFTTCGSRSSIRARAGEGQAHKARPQQESTACTHQYTQTTKHGAVCLFHYLLSTTTNRLQPSNVGHVVCCRVVPPLRVTQHKPAHVSVAVVALPPSACMRVCVYSARAAIVLFFVYHNATHFLLLCLFTRCIRQPRKGRHGDS